MIEQLNKKLKELEIDLENSDKENLKQRNLLNLAKKALQETIKVFNVFNSITQKVIQERNNLNVILNEKNNKSSKLKELEKDYENLFENKSETEKTLKSLVSEVSKLEVSKKEHIQAIKDHKEQINILSREREAGIYNRDRLKNELDNLKKEKENTKINIAIFVERSKELGIDTKEGLRLLCEDDEEVVSQVRTSQPGKKYYLISKKI